MKHDKTEDTGARYPVTSEAIAQLNKNEPIVEFAFLHDRRTCQHFSICHFRADNATIRQCRMCGMRWLISKEGDAFQPIDATNDPETLKRIVDAAIEGRLERNRARTENLTPKH